MPVQPESLEVLEKAAVPPAQARAIVRAIEIEIAGAKDTLATKQDLLVLRHEIADVRAELKADVAELRHEVAELRSELKADIAGLRSELKADMAGLRGELRSEIHSSASSVTRQMYTAILGQFALLLGVAYFFVSHLPR